MKPDCPTDTALAELVEGMVPADQSAALGQHVANCADCADLLSSLRDGGLAGTGVHIGRYRILELLGEGAAGKVYAAHDPRLHRKVALKVVSRAAFGDSGQRVLREARAAAQLSHPNVIAIHDVEELDGGGACLAMELVDGPSLSAWRRSAWRSWRDIARVFAAAGRGLAAAHAAGIVHRDFKPDNVLCAGDGRVLVGDFGLARVDGSAEVAPPAGDPGEPVEQSLFRTGALLGTPAYMAPEQLTGLGADARSDQFSFAVAFYESLHGERPFAGERLTALIDNVLAGELRPAPIGSAVPRWLRRLLERALSVDPEQRFPSMAALLAQLDRGLARRRWFAYAAAAAVVIAGVGLSPLVLAGDPPACSNLDRPWTQQWSAVRRQAIESRFAASGNPAAGAAWHATQRALDRFGRDWSAMRVDTCRATRVAHEQSPELFDLRMLCLDDSLHRAGALLELLGDADAAMVDAAAQAAAELGVGSCSAEATVARRNLIPNDPAIARSAAEIRDRIGRAFMLRAAGRLDQALELATATAADARALAFRPVEAEARYTLGVILDERDDSAHAVEELSAAVWAAEACGHTEQVALAASRLIALSGTGEGALERGKQWADHATAAIEHLGKPADLAVKRQLGLGLLYHRNGKDAEAVVELERGLALVGADAATMPVANLYNNLANSYTDLQEVDKARRAADKAIAIFSSQLHPEHPFVLRARNNLGVLFNDTHQFQSALAIFDDLIAIRRRAPGREPGELANVLVNRAVGLSGLRRFEEALATYREALAIFRAETPDSSSVALVLGNMSRSLSELGRTDEAIEHLTMSNDLKRKKLGAAHPSLGLGRLNLAQLLARAGRPADALAESEQAHAILEARLGKQHLYVAYCLASEGAAHAELGQLGTAERQLEAAQRILALSPTEVEAMGEVEFALARTVSRRGQNARACKLADSALAHYRAVDNQPELAKVEAWIRTACK